jgi:hypothetical protein
VAQLSTLGHYAHIAAIYIRPPKVFAVFGFKIATFLADDYCAFHFVCSAIPTQSSFPLDFHGWFYVFQFSLHKYIAVA